MLPVALPLLQRFSLTAFILAMRGVRIPADPFRTPMPALFEVFTQPGKVFAGLPERRAGWVVPLIVNTLLLLASTVVTLKVIGMEQIMRTRFAASNLSPEQMQRAMQQATSPVATNVTYASVVIGAPVSMLAVAGALFAFGWMTSRAPKFSSMFAMVNLAFFPYFLITVLMTVLVMIVAPDKTALDVSNILATNVGAFVNRLEVSKGLYALYSSLDVLSFAEICLLSFGFSKLTRTSFFAGLGAVGCLWVFYVMCKMVLSLFQ
jgi:hypothetical protein